MKNYTLYYLLLIAVIFNLTSCGDKDEDIPAPSKQDLLTAKTWQPSKIIVDGLDISSNPSFAFALQVNYKFKADKTYIISLLGSSEPGTWEFSSNETVILLDAGTVDENRWTIVELKENSFKATEIDPSDNSHTQWEFVPKL